MVKVGFVVLEDVIGNIYGWLEGENLNLLVVIVGFYFDFVLNGGVFDGLVGVIIGFEVVIVFYE